MPKKQYMRGFGSDNHAPVHPQLMASLNECNVMHAPSYGTDNWSLNAENKFRQLFGKTTQCFFVFNGTAANALSMRAICKPWQSVLCTDLSHLNVDECGAPEYFSGGKLIPIKSKNGKLQLADVKTAFIRRGDQHFSQIKAISLTQPTELGTVYSVSELKELVGWAKSENLFVHMDGARFANACHTLKISPVELSSQIGIDILSLGGTKNGFMFGEVILIFNEKLAEDFKYIRKQSAQLPSKSRYIAAQFCTYFENDLWQRIAEHSCNMAQEFYKKLIEFPEIKVTQVCQSNAVFAIFPKEWIKPLKEIGFFYVWDEVNFECRLMCSWDTQISDLDLFINKINSLRGEA